MTSTLLERLQTLFRKVFKDDHLVITPLTSAKDITYWDSLMHITLITAIEAEFGYSFTFNEVMQINNVEDIIRLIDKKLKK
jgi:acyl carrier protein